MALQTVSLEFQLFRNGEAVNQFIPELSYDDAITTPLSSVTVSASASDETVNMPILRLGTTLKCLELYVSEDDLNKITVKANSSSKAYKVSPIYILSENLSALTASNSSTAEVTLYWRATYI